LEGIMSNEVSTDLNTVIVAAVNARVEAAVLEALSGDQFLAQYVAAALNQQIEVKERAGYYNDRTVKTTFLKNAITEAVKGATQAAVKRVLAEDADALEEAVRKELRKQAPTIAKQLVGTVAEAAEKPYGVTVGLKFPGRD
jgi:Mrp family chromosome partitioning ATPase